MSDKFRSAGELYGHLLAVLTFGDLTMRGEGQCFVYQWRFKINNKHLSAEIRVTDAELMQTCCLGDLARTEAAGLRREIKESRR
ncbi:MAG: hypothetical protein ACO20Y_08695 [Poseidonia sp.]